MENEILKDIIDYACRKLNSDDLNGHDIKINIKLEKEE